MSVTITSAAEESTATPLADRLAPSIPAVVFLVLALFVPLFAQQHLLNGDGDAARHIRHGLYMLQHHSLIRNDPFSFTRPGQPYVAFEYGSQVIYALVYLFSGLAGVTIFAGCLIGATYALLARLLLRKGVDPLLAALTVIAAAVLGAVHWLARPHLISWLAIVLLFGVVESKRRYPVWFFAIFFVVWANIHGGWLYGIAMLGIYAVGNVAEYYCFGRQQEHLVAARYFTIALVASLLATLATPMGLGLWAHLRGTFDTRYIVDHTAEFLSPDFHPIAGRAMLAVIVGSTAALMLSRRRMHCAHFVLFVAGIWWLLLYRRNIPLFGITGLSVAAIHLDADWRALPITWLRRRRENFAAGAARANTAGWISTCCVLLAILAVTHGSIMGSQVIANEFDNRRFPVDALKYADSNHLRGRIFTDWGWGGYLLFARPRDSVFIDGGTDFYGAELMREHDRIRSLAPGWRGILDRWKIESVFTGPHSRLAHEMVRGSGWSLWYCDSVAVILRRDSSQAVGSPDDRESQLGVCAGPDSSSAAGAN